MPVDVMMMSTSRLDVISRKLLIINIYYMPFGFFGYGVKCHFFNVINDWVRSGMMLV